ncbi:MAG: GNAT family N-acetyltransferase [Saprospiraceae bacterium]
MENKGFTYRMNTANAAQIGSHLRDCSGQFNPPLHEKVDIDAYSAKMAEYAVLFEAWDEDLLVGLVAAYYNDTVNHIGFITNVSTMSRYAGKGVASALMEACIDYGRQQGFQSLRLEVNQQSHSAINLYHKFNFTILEEGADVFHMNRPL